jgi:hypothetical protein
MKMLMIGLAAVMFATVAVAQTQPVPPPPAPESPDVTQTQVAPAVEPATPEKPEVAALVWKDGKWWKGDRRATKEEIAEQQRSRPQ